MIDAIAAIAEYKSLVQKAKTIEVQLFNHFHPLIEEKLKRKDFRGALDLLEQAPSSPTHYKLWQIIQKAK